MHTPPNWGRPPTAPRLARHEVHVWRAYLPAHRSRLAALAQRLAPDERKAAERFRFEADRERYILSRGLLREILYRYLDVAPEQLTFSYGLHGKPILRTPSDSGWLRFNLSHAHDVALYALCRDMELGVDIERIRPDITYERIAQRFFSPYEVATLAALAPDMRAEAFFRCWTIKEAYVKGHGAGLSLPLAQFDCALTPGAPPAILATRPDAAQAHRWTIKLLEPGSDYAAALAVDGKIDKLTCWRVEPVQPDRKYPSTPMIALLPLP